MANDFDMREGTTKPINIIVTDGAIPTPTEIDLTGATLIWVAATQAGTLALAKHSTDISPTIILGTNPAIIEIEILPTDAVHLPIGTYEHEVRVIQGLVQEVVYPIGTATATFGVIQSYTWDATTNIPRLERPTTLNARAQSLWGTQ